MQQEVFVLQGSRLKEMILEKAHMSNMSFQPGETKMYHDFKKNFLWYGMKRKSDLRSSFLRVNQAILFT